PCPASMSRCCTVAWAAADLASRATSWRVTSPPCIRTAASTTCTRRCWSIRPTSRRRCCATVRSAPRSNPRPRARSPWWAPAPSRGPGIGPRLMSGLVTGVLGFIGGYITRELADSGRDVTVLARTATPTPEMAYALRDQLGRYTVEVGSVEDLDGLVEVFGRVNPKDVVHCASSLEVANRHRAPHHALT